MLSIQNHQKRLPYLSRQLRYRAKKVLREVGLQNAEISVLLCDDATIQELNLEWRDIDKPTDVLSFPLLEPLEGKEQAIASQIKDLEIPPMLGDIVISVDTCIRQAKEWNHSVIEEAIRLWIHGLLHLCGYDHIDNSDAIQMKTKEEELLSIFRGSKITPLVQN